MTKSFSVRSSSSSWIASLALISLVASVGCNNVKTEKAVPVSGVLKYQGKPLEGYRITFEPVDTQRQGATATTETGGAFKMGTNVPGDGAAPGQHRVAVVFLAEKMEGEPGKETMSVVTPKVKIPKKYESAATSEVTVDIPAAGNTALEIDLK